MERERVPASAGANWTSKDPPAKPREETKAMRSRTRRTLCHRVPQLLLRGWLSHSHPDIAPMAKHVSAVAAEPRRKSAAS